VKSRLSHLPDIKTFAGYLIAGATGGGVACLSVLIFILFYQVKNTGSAAEWIASVANASMAVTAVLVFKVARSWLPQLTTQEGYKLAIELVNDHYIWLGPQNNLLRKAGWSMAYICHLQDGKTMEGSTVSYEDVIASLNTVLIEHKNRRDTMEKIRFRLGTYGLCEAPTIRARFEVLDGAYFKACDAASTLREILTEMKNILTLVPTYKPGSGMMFNEPVDEKLMLNRNHAEQIYEKLSENYSLMLNTYSELFSAHPSIGKLFEVRK